MTQTVFLTLSLDDLRATISEVVQTELSKLSLKPIEETEKLITRKEAAKMLRVSLPTLNHWEKEGILLPKRIGARVLYSSVDIARVLEGDGLQRTRNRQR